MSDTALPAGTFDLGRLGTAKILDIVAEGLSRETGRHRVELRFGFVRRWHARLTALYDDADRAAVTQQVLAGCKHQLPASYADWTTISITDALVEQLAQLLEDRHAITVEVLQRARELGATDEQLAVVPEMVAAEIVRLVALPAEGAA